MSARASWLFAGEELAILVAELQPREQLGAAIARAQQRLQAPPATDAPVVAREQRLGHADAAEQRRPRVLRVLEQARFERFVDGRVGVAEDAWQPSRHRVDDDHG